MKSKLSHLSSLLAITLALLLTLTSCNTSPQTGGNLMTNIHSQSSAASTDRTGPGADVSASFGLELLRRSLESQPNENILLSPLSILSALTMTARGASGETLAQMEAALGLPADQLGEWLAAYSSGLPSEEKARFHQANSIWLRQGAVEVERDFLQWNADYFGADMYEKPFDGATLREINDWVKEHTRQMIPSILDELSPQSVMVLANALAFEGEWEEIYQENDVWDGNFTREDGGESPVKLMHSTEYKYLRDGDAAGFLKFYQGGEYAFAALLPPEDTSLAAYVDSLTGQRLREVLANAQDQTVLAAIPKFETEYSAALGELLQSMGMTDAFDPSRADFSLMGRAAGEDPLYIGQVVHKTFLSVFEQGTKAGAATAVVMEAGGAMEEEPPQVYLDRPFLYMIVDTQTSTPIFIGTVYDPA